MLVHFIKLRQYRVRYRLATRQHHVCQELTIKRGDAAIHRFELCLDDQHQSTPPLPAPFLKLTTHHVIIAPVATFWCMSAVLTIWHRQVKANGPPILLEENDSALSFIRVFPTIAKASRAVALEGIPCALPRARPARRLPPFLQTSPRQSH